VRILGANKGVSCGGKTLRDGGLALLVDGQIELALQEERLTRNLRAGGFEQCLDFVRHSLRLDLLKQIDVVAMSTCCEPRAAAVRGHWLQDHPGLMAVGHHESHAWFAFAASGYDEALVVIIDGGGNTTVDSATTPWWELPREQHSYYAATHSGLQLVGEDFDEPGDLGFGELYRAATYFLGWPSSRFAGNLMALASHGVSERISRDRFIEFVDGQMSCPIPNDPLHPADIIVRLADSLGMDFGAPRVANTADGLRHDLHERLWDFAAYIQWNVEEALLDRLRWLQRSTGLRRLCLGGGFALNCVANGRVAESGLFDQVYVPPAPGDHGQSVGNVTIAWRLQSGRLPSPMRTSEQACLGLPIDLGDDPSRLSRLLRGQGLGQALVSEPRDLPAQTARLIAAGHAVCVSEGRSELGLRALGHRSILMRADCARSAAVAGAIKRREWFRPFAPALLPGTEVTTSSRPRPSPFMAMALTIDADHQSQLSGTISPAGRARVQDVDSESFLGQLLSALGEMTGSAVCLNTSFNLKGQPIVETAEDAVAAFRELPVSFLMIERFLVMKSLPANAQDLGLVGPCVINNVTLRARPVDVKAPPGVSLRRLATWITEHTGSMAMLRRDFSLFADYLAWLREGRKSTTIRWHRGFVEVPGDQVLPVYECEVDNRVPDRSQSPSAWVQIRSIEYAQFGTLDQDDARRDGFESRKQMRAQFRDRIYRGICDQDWVTVYSLELAEAPTDPREEG